MKLSIFTTVTDPDKRGDNWQPAFQCYADLADEVVVIDGSSQPSSPKQDSTNCDWVTKNYEWPEEFAWPLIGEQFQRGYEACSGDWVIHADIDFIFHENDLEAIRRACLNSSESPALSFWKYQLIQPDSYNLKSRLVVAVNKRKYGQRIRFDSGGDLCQPSLDGQEIKPDSVPEARVPLYNYEKLTKTKQQIIKDVGRMDRAYKQHFGKFLYSEDGSDESAYEGWYRMVKGRYGKPQSRLFSHPKYMLDTIGRLQPQHFGYNGFGLRYV